MNKLENDLKELGKKILLDKTVGKIIGYSYGTLAGKCVPVFIDKPEEAGKLTWNSFCDTNLARYIKKEIPKEGKIAIIAKGCTGRAITQLLIEKQFPREKLYILGINCAGTIDRRRIANELGSTEILEIIEKEDKILVKGTGFEKEFPRAEYLNYLCKVCKYPIPPIYDVLVGTKEPKGHIHDKYEDTLEFEKKTPDEKWAYFNETLKNCTRCYACREACPLCYCLECFCDQTQPSWFCKSAEHSEIAVFHLVRAMHLAGRCVACGDCNVVCPMGIDLIPITRKLEKIVKDRFDAEVGIDPSKPPSLSTFCIEDQEEFFEEEE